MSEPIIVSTGAGPSWRAVAGWAIGSAFTFTGIAAGLLGRMIEKSYGWIPAKISRMAEEQGKQGTSLKTAEAEIDNLRRINEGDKSGEQMAAFDVRLGSVEKIVGKFDEKMDRILETRNEGGLR